MTAPDEVPVRPRRPESAVRRFGLRSGFTKPTSSDIHWLLGDLEETGGPGRVATSRLGLVAVLSVGLGLYGYAAFDSALLAFGLAPLVLVLASAILAFRFRRRGVSTALYGSSGIQSGRAVVDTAHVKKQTQGVRVSVFAGVVYAGIGLFRIFASEPAEPPSIVGTSCAQTGDGIEITTTVDNPSDDPVLMTLEVDLEGDTGDRYTGNVSASPEPRREEVVSVETGATGEPVECTATIVSVTRVDVGPGVSVSVGGG